MRLLDVSSLKQGITLADPIDCLPASRYPLSGINQDILRHPKPPKVAPAKAEEVIEIAPVQKPLLVVKENVLPSQKGLRCTIVRE